jgi:hypothetical protein
VRLQFLKFLVSASHNSHRLSFQAELYISGCTSVTVFFVLVSGSSLHHFLRKLLFSRTRYEQLAIINFVSHANDKKKCLTNDILK